MADALDSRDMESIIRRFPSQFHEGLAAAKGVKVPGGPFKSVQVAGMGGSWMAAALVADGKLASVPIRIHRGYQLPDPLRLEAPLVVASSFSGNTREVLSAYEAARQAGLPLVGISSDGELARRCEKDKVAFVPIPADPPDMQPRCATGYTVGILTRLLDNHALAAQRAVAAVEALVEPLEEFMETARSRAKRLLPELRQATPVIYTSQRYRTVARIFKIKINENAKTPAFWNVFPELNHNEMVGWTRRHGPFHLIFLRDPEEDPCVLKRMDLARELLGEHGVSSAVVPIEGPSLQENLLEKMFRTLLVGDWTSYELALALGVDPTPVDMIEDFKRQLRALDNTC